MAEDFVPYELAVKLKEKGYPQRCCGEYDMIGACYVKDGRLYEDGCIAPVENCFTAPRIDQVLKWLREERLILIGLAPMQEYGSDEVVKWCAAIYKAGKQGGLIWQEDFYNQSYEQAVIRGIEYTLDNMI